MPITVLVDLALREFTMSYRCSQNEMRMPEQRHPEMSMRALLPTKWIRLCEGCEGLPEKAGRQRISPIRRCITQTVQLAPRSGATLQREHAGLRTNGR